MRLEIDGGNAMKLTRKTFTTKDSGGCSVRVEAYYTVRYCQINRQLVSDARYTAMGLESDSLADLKKRIGDL